MIMKYKEKILSLIIGMVTALISMLIYQIIQKLDTLWITILAIWLNVLTNFLIAAISYQLQTDNIVTEGDLYIKQYGGINFNFGIILLSATLQYQTYFVQPCTVYEYVASSTLPFWLLLLYAGPASEYNEEEIE